MQHGLLLRRSRTSRSEWPAHLFPLPGVDPPDATHHSLGSVVPCLVADKRSNLGQSFSGTFPTKTELHLTSAPLRAAKQRKYQLISSGCQCFQPVKRIWTGMLNYQVLSIKMRARESTDTAEPAILALEDQPAGWLAFQSLAVKPSCLLSHSTFPTRRRWQPTPALLPGKAHGRRSLVGGSPWGR